MPKAAKTLRQTDVKAERYRRTTQSWYHSRGWRNAAKQFRILHPYCVKCRPIVRNSEVVDHIKPHNGDLELFWDPDNWQALCIPCHNAKTRAEQG